MAETRDVRLYIYAVPNNRGTGVTLTESQTIELERYSDYKPNPEEKKNPVTGKITSRTTVLNYTVYSLEVSLLKLEYTKKIYEPCKIVAHLQVGTVMKRTDVYTEVITFDENGESSTDLKTDIGTFMPTKLLDNDKINLLRGALVDLEIDKNKVAENYYVHKVRSVYKTVSGKTSLFVELTIYSRDKMMTLDKYSRAYTARRLYTDILVEESQKFSSVEVANHMQLLKYKESETQNETTCDVTKRDELRIPYLVQYNESFYQFMVRCANRFGEFLYFEDGKLNLGMQPSETNYYRRDSSGKLIQTNDAYDIIDWATEPNAVQSRYYESVISEGISVEDRAYSYMTHKPDENEAYAESADSRYNFDPVSTDEWTKQDLKKNEYHNFWEVLGEEIKASLPELLFKAIETKSLGEAIVQLGLEFAGKGYEIFNNVFDFNNQLDEANYQSDDNYLIEEDQRSDNNYKQFVTYDGSSNLSDNLNNMFKKIGLNNFTDLFYQTIRKKEKEVGEQAVWLDFGNYYRPIKLGDKLKVAEKDYVAISVEGSYENGQEHLLVSAIPVYSLSTTTPTPQSSTTSSDPWTPTVPFPPALPGVVIRDARPQVAFVAETLDPENLGRIRVRYPWQDEKGDPSPWIRITLPLATTGGAVNFTPCVGDEVMVGYEHGNIEHPYGMGYLAAPFVNEKWKNALPLDQYGGIHGIRTKTGHHLTFSDGFAFMPMLMNTMGPLSCIKSLWPVGLAGPWPLGYETTADFGGGFELSDRYGFYKISGSTDERSVTIESPAGTVELNAFQGITISAPNGDIEINGKNVSISASNNLKIVSGNTIKDKLYYKKEWKDANKSKFLTSLADFKDSALETLKSETLEKFQDMSFLRTVLELFLRPVDGTLQIKSYSFVCIEAGEGGTELPNTSLMSGKGSDDNKDLNDLGTISISVALIGLNVNALIDDIQPKYDKLCEATEAFNSISCQGGVNNNECVISYSDIITKGETAFTEEDQTFKWDAADLVVTPADEFTKEEPKLEDFEDDSCISDAQTLYNMEHDKWVEERNAYMQMPTYNKIQNRKVRRKIILNTANQLRIAAKELSDTAKKWTDMKDDELDILTFGDLDIDKSSLVGKFVAATLLSSKGIVSLSDMSDCSYDKTISKPDKFAWEQQKLALRRYIAFKYVTTFDYLTLDDTKITSLDDAMNNKKWRQFVESIEPDPDKTTLKSFFNTYVNPFRGLYEGIWENHRKWKQGFKGQILMSDRANKTVSFDENLLLKAHPNRDYFEENFKELRNFLKNL